MMFWEYEGNKIKTINDFPTDAVGFIYCITFSNGKKYIGKKNLYTTRKKHFGKKQLALITDKRLKTYELITKESDWKTYNGSQKDVKLVLKNKETVISKKEILYICNSLKKLTYFELKALIVEGCLEKEEYYNDNILGKFFRSEII